MSPGEEKEKAEFDREREQQGAPKKEVVNTV